jgi:hypothetical protein
VIAALGADGWHQEGRSRPITIAWPNVEPTIEWWLRGMRRHEVDVLYVHASALELLGLPAELEPPAPGDRRPRHPWLAGVTFEGQRVSHQALAPSIECAGLEVLIGAYQGGAGDPFDAAGDARELLAATLAFREAFKGRGRGRGWAYRNSAIQTGWKLMHAPWERGARKGRLAELAARPGNPLPELEGAGRQVEVPYGGRWARDPAGPRSATPDGRELGWVLAWDVNGQRLAATGRLSLGVGGADHVTWRDAGASFDPKLPGYHLVRSVEHPHAGLIPAIFEPGWHTTPRVAMARHLGIAFELEQSWIWPHHVPYLNPWYEAMRDARLQLLVQAAVYQGASGPNVGHLGRAHAIALGALKQCYLQPLGRLRSLKAREQGSPLYRPDWYDHVIGQELAREYLRLHQLAVINVPVLAVYFDTIIIESDTPDLVAGAPAGIEVSSQLGKFKPLGVLPTADAHQALYGGERNPDVGALVKALKAAGGVETPASPAATPPAALSAFTRPAHGGYSPPPSPAAGLIELARQGVYL